MARMAHEWIGVQDRLERDILTLAQELARKVKTGEAVSQSQLWELQRYQSLLAQTRTQVQGYAGWAEGAISHEQMEMGLLGQAHAGAAIRSYGIAGTFDRLQPEAFRNMVGLTGNGSPLKDLLVQGWPDAVDGLTKALLNGTALGWNPRKTAREMRNGVDNGLNRMLRIARTEQIRVYRFSARERYQDSGVVSGYKRIAAKQGRTCVACLVLDGTEYDVSEELDDHVNGRCHPGGVLVGGPSPVAASSRYYRGELVTIRTAGGAQLTFTPNHPILTGHGWVAGGFLQEGDYVVSGAFSQNTATAVNEDDDHMPALIEEVAESFGMVSGEMPCAAEDFHGDGVGSEVYVVRANGLLSDSGDAAIGQPHGQQAFGRGTMGYSGLSGLGNLGTVVYRMMQAARSLLGNLDASQMFGHRRALCQQLVGGGLVPTPHTSFEQSRLDCRAGNPKGAGEFIFGLSSIIAGSDFLDGQIGFGHCGRGHLGRLDGLHGGAITPEATCFERGLQGNFCGMDDARCILGAHARDIQLDRVVEVSRTAFSGHVYNLQAQAGWYRASDNIAHNGDAVKCLFAHNCSMVPIVRGYKAPSWPSGRDWFLDQDEDMQAQIMGKGAFEKWRDGEIALDDLVVRKHDSVWGDSVGVRSVGA